MCVDVEGLVSGLQLQLWEQTKSSWPFFFPWHLDDLSTKEACFCLFADYIFTPNKWPINCNGHLSITRLNCCERLIKFSAVTPSAWEISLVKNVRHTATCQSNLHSKSPPSPPTVPLKIHPCLAEHLLIARHLQSSLRSMGMNDWGHFRMQEEQLFWTPHTVLFSLWYSVTCCCCIRPKNNITILINNII